MIYFYRTLWAVLGIPVYLITCLAFAIGFITYPLVGMIHYIIHGTVYMDWEVDTMAMFIEKKYSKLKERLEKQNDL
jgi:hypothetical protein